MNIINATSVEGFVQISDELQIKYMKYCHINNNHHLVPLICVCGLSSVKEDWSEELINKLLISGRTIVVMDNRGIGESSIPENDWCIDDMANDVLEVATHLNIKKFDLFGCSMGGMIVQTVALLAPKRINKLIIGCSYFGGPNAKQSNTLLKAMDVSYLKKHGERKFMERIIGVNLTAKYVKENQQHFNTIIDNILLYKRPFKGIVKQMGAIVQFDIEDRLKSIEVPTLIIHGDQDEILPYENSLLIKEHISHAKLVTLNNCGHMFWIMMTNETALAINEFLSDSIKSHL